MFVKKLFLFIFAISIFTVSGNALERRKPLPLKELQNPNGPSYVPIPYPQTDEEVITDLKHFIKFRVINKKRMNVSGIYETASNLQKICFDYINNKGISVGEIVKVKNKLIYRERDYSFLIRLKNENNYDVARFGMLASGILALWSSVNLKDLSQNSSRYKELLFKPLMKKSIIKEEIKSMTGFDLDAEEMKNINLVEGQSLIGDLLDPAWEIYLKDGRVLFKSDMLHAVFELEEKLNTENKDFKVKLATKLENSERDYKHFNQSAIGEYLILKKMENVK